jgi:HD-GYP domain-containing protein (c-di-GMP phosphodiesterase class II)
MAIVSVATLKSDSRFTEGITIDQNFLVCAPGLPLTRELIAALKEWNFPDVCSTGQLTSEELYDSAVNTEAFVDEEISVTVVKGMRLKEALEQTSFLTDPGASEDERIAAVESIYDMYLEYIDAVYTRYATHQELWFDDISDVVKSLCGFIAASKRYVLRIQPKAPPENKNYLVNHAMRSTVLAIVMGMRLTLPSAKLVELGVSCILHEIGMIRLPPQIYLANRKLTLWEKKQLFTHPLLGYNILKACEFPLPIMLGVLDHHEKEDGSGYPRRLLGGKISVLAKIISVACSYEAITSPRTYKNEDSAYAAMMDLIKSRGKQYDETIIRALLVSISLYPIGAYVYLSDGRVGLTVDVNPDNPKNPIVQLVNERKPDGTPKIIAPDGTQLSVSRVLTPAETASIKKH